MLNWLPQFQSLFPEAVGLAVQMPCTQIDSLLLIGDLEVGEQWENNPDSVADLLVYVDRFGGAVPPQSSWHELIERLLRSNLCDARRIDLQELRARLGTLL